MMYAHACRVLSLTAMLATLSSEVDAGLTMPNFPESPGSSICINMFGVPPALRTLPALNGSQLLNRSIADLSSMMSSGDYAADADAFCKGDRELPSGRRSPFRGEWLVRDGVNELCGFGELFRLTNPERIIALYKVALGADALGALILPAQSSKKRTVFSYPSLVMNADYGIPEHLHEIAARSITCNAFDGDETAALGSSTGELNGVRVNELRVNIIVDDSPWTPTFEHPLYFLFFSVAMPLTSLAIGILAVQSLSMHRARLRQVKKKIPIDLPQAVLGLELVSQFLCGVYFLITGHWARSAHINYCLTFQLGLTGLGMCTTFLTAFFWQDLKTVCMNALSTGSSRAQKKSIWNRHGLKLGAMCAFFVMLDGIGALMTIYVVKGFEFAMVAFYNTCQVAVAIYFVREVRGGIKFFIDTLSASAGDNGKSPQHERTMRRFTIAAKWLFRSALCMMGYPLITIPVGASGLMWLPQHGTIIFYVGMHITRCLISLTQIMAVRPPSKSLSSKKSSRVTVASTASSVSSSVVSTMDSSTRPSTDSASRSAISNTASSGSASSNTSLSSAGSSTPVVSSKDTSQ